MKEFKLSFLLLVATSLLVGCGSVKGMKKDKHNNEYMMLANVWYQNAAEVRALSYQAFNVAKIRLDQDLKKRSKKRRAIVVDVDETIVDNSPYQAKNILKNESYSSSSWQVWVDMAKAKALPGAVEFLNYAKKKGVEVFYITNRKEKGKYRGFVPTMKNLKALGFPVKKENLLLRTGSSSKTKRRAEVTKNHRIVLFMGDNMTDFSELFEHKLTKDRNALTDKMRKSFGKKFIVLPNPMYGDWENAVYEYNFKKSKAQKSEDRVNSLHSM